MSKVKKVIITQKAQQDIDEIIEGIIEYTGFEVSGIRLYNELYEKFELIGFMPSGIGRLRDDGTRETFTRRYRIVYKEFDDEVWIITVIHSSRIYPRPS